ncbi:MAG TPA: hypothetical protein DCP90_06750 [Clostridiales bacterium]|nr:hypothetical protein [Clostridiales bacterium]
MSRLNKFLDWIASKIASKIIIQLNKELSKQNEDICILLKEELAIIKEQNMSNKKQIAEISKQLDVLGRTLRGKGFN